MARYTDILAFVALVAATGSIHAEGREGSSVNVTLVDLAFDKALNGAKPAAGSTNETLVVESGPKTDFFRETDGATSYGNAPVLLSGIDNSRPWTFSIHVAPTLNKTYDAGAAYIWVNETNWLKFAFERDEQDLSRIVTVRTHGTSDDNNHDAVAADSVFLKVSSDTKSLGFYYSKDGKSWQLVRVFRNDYPKNLSIGLSAQSPLGTGNSASFTQARFKHESVRDFRKGE